MRTDLQEVWAATLFLHEEKRRLTAELEQYWAADDPLQVTYLCCNGVANVACMSLNCSYALFMCTVEAHTRSMLSMFY